MTHEYRDGGIVFHPTRGLILPEDQPLRLVFSESGAIIDADEKAADDLRAQEQARSLEARREQEQGNVAADAAELAADEQAAVEEVRRLTPPGVPT